jgi:lipopolysaccharide export LptBFGC system permease protein LptF
MIALDFHWLYIPFAIIVTVVLGLLFSLRSQGDYDFGTPMIGCGLLLVLGIVFAVFGGIMWW